MLPPFMTCSDEEMEYPATADVLAEDEVVERCIHDSNNDYKISFIGKVDSAKPFGSMV